MPHSGIQRSLLEELEDSPSRGSKRARRDERREERNQRERHAVRRTAVRRCSRGMQGEHEREHEREKTRREQDMPVIDRHCTSDPGEDGDRAHQDMPSA
jgi:ribosomal protein S20